MIYLTISLTIIIIIIVRGFYKSIPYMKFTSVKKNTEFLLTSIQLESLPFAFNAPKINMFLILFIISIVVFVNIIGFIDVLNSHTAYCMDLNEKKNFDSKNLQFLRQKMRESEQLTSTINSLNNKPKYFKNLDLNSSKIGYNFIFDFKKYKMREITPDGTFFYTDLQYPKNYSYLIPFEKKFNNTNTYNQRLIISLEILIHENTEKCCKFYNTFHKAIFNPDYLVNKLQTPIQTKDYINKIVSNTIKDVENSYNILYSIRSHPNLIDDEKKYLLKIFKSSFPRFLPDYGYIDEHVIKKILNNSKFLNKNDVNNKNFFEIFSKFHDLNFKNFTLIKDMSLIKEKKLQNIIITSPTPPEPVLYSSGEDLARIMDGTLDDSGVDSPFSFENSDEETKSSTPYNTGSNRTNIYSQEIGSPLFFENSDEETKGEVPPSNIYSQEIGSPLFFENSDEETKGEVPPSKKRKI